ncbi:MAG: hypothetical protein IJR14_07535, partial [Synergistaceae bacterium]|nr:hypothetical protein [Synergistaceae bacterium]
MGLMRMQQPSFANGEITPLLHARADLERWHTALAGLGNMIVLPTGGVTRRPGFQLLGAAVDDGPVRLVPFVYEEGDSAMLELGDRKMRAWRSGAPGTVITTPWALADVKDVRWAQAGNVMFIVHRKYMPQMLTRTGADAWTLEDFPFEGGPWASDTGGVSASQLTVTQADGMVAVIVVPSAVAGTFSYLMVGSLIRLDWNMPGKTVDMESLPAPQWAESEAFEVGESLNVQTGGNWAGKIEIQRSVDGGTSWGVVRSFLRTDTDKQGQIDYTVTEKEKDVLFRVRAQHERGPIKITITVAGWIKETIWKIAYANDHAVNCKRVLREHEVAELPDDAAVIDWKLGAWGREQSYPGAVELYQDRLVLAGTEREPQTLWMSRVGDWKDFSVSDPLADDDAITITLTAKTAEPIHSLVATQDILAFTTAGEWKISGAGDAGAISPKAVVAHQQGDIGSRPIQPLRANGRVIFVQTGGTKVYSFGYELETDGYGGNELSILASHLFDWKTAEGSAPTGRDIIDISWQQIPDGLLWCALADGTAATCTYCPEHGVTGWARQETTGRIVGLATLPGERQTEQWAVVRRGGQHRIERLARRMDEAVFTDCGNAYESWMKTLRLTWD